MKYETYMFYKGSGQKLKADGMGGHEYDFPKIRGGGQRPFETFPKIHPFWRRLASLSFL